MLKEAWAALDAARIPAWRRWKKRLHAEWKRGASFDEGFNLATDQMQAELQPFYDAVMRSSH
jgi:hypothetical protein